MTRQRCECWLSGRVRLSFCWFIMDSVILRGRDDTVETKSHSLVLLFGFQLVAFYRPVAGLDAYVRLEKLSDWIHEHSWFSNTDYIALVLIVTINSDALDFVFPLGSVLLI